MILLLPQITKTSNLSLKLKKKDLKAKMCFEGSVCLNNIKVSVFYLASLVCTYTPIYRYSKGNSSRHISFFYFPSKLMSSQAHYQRTVFFQHHVSKIYAKGNHCNKQIIITSSVRNILMNPFHKGNIRQCCRLNVSAPKLTC